MTDAPVGDGRDGGTGPEAEDKPVTAGPGRIRVSEVPDLEPEDGDVAAGDEGADDAEDSADGGSESQTSASPRPGRIPVSEVPDLEPEDGDVAAGDEGADDAEDSADDPAAAQTVAAKPVAPQDDLAFAETAIAAPRKPDSALRDPDPRGDADAAAAGTTEPESDHESDREPDPEPGADPAESEAESEAEARRVTLAEVEETTLIPKVAEGKPVETTTVMPAVPAQPDMARRPYSDDTAAGAPASADAGPAAARRGYRSAERGRAATRSGGKPPQGYGRGGAGPAWTAPPGPASGAAAPTAAKPATPTVPRPGSAPGAGSAAAPEPGPRAYRPPEFHAVDPQRAELPPPHNFPLDQREIDGDDGPARGIGRRALLVGGGVAVAAAAGLTLAGVIRIPGTTPAVPTVGFSPAADSGASPATQTGTAFLNAWQAGQLAQAANLTDDPQAALAAMTAYHKALGVSGMVINPNPANGVGWMTYAITTQAGTPMGEWQYSGGFATYWKQINGYTRWFVKWNPAILYTSLKPGYRLTIKKTPATIQGLVDRNGKPVDPAAHPSLAGIISRLISSAEASGGTAGQDIIMTDAKGKQLAKVTTLTKPINHGTVPTTLDMDVQHAAESAVPRHSYSSMVAIQPSTGHILAIANNTTSQYYDDALLAGVAPGSTFKIITSTALLSKGLTTLSSDVPCPAVITIDRQVLKNSEGEAGDYTYEQDFATSCNNAFSSFWDHSGMGPNLLSDTARTYFGLNQEWDIGLGESASYMKIPTGLTRGLLAESLVGQGDVQSCPLAMCSVVATVAHGTFMQPILLPGQKQLTATPLGSKLQGELKTLMGSVVKSGTAAGVGFPQNGHFFAKTGTAEVTQNGKTTNNSWFVVFDDQHDLALCALAIDGGYGAETAAPECLKVFHMLGYA